MIAFQNRGVKDSTWFGFREMNSKLSESVIKFWELGNSFYNSGIKYTDHAII